MSSSLRPRSCETGLKVCGVIVESRDFIDSWLNDFVVKFEAYCCATHRFSSAAPQAFAVLRTSTCTKASHLARLLPPAVLESFAARLDDECFAVLAKIVGSDVARMPQVSKNIASLPMRVGGLGMSSLQGSLHAAYAACALEVFGSGLTARMNILGANGEPVSVEAALRSVPGLLESLEWIWSNGGALCVGGQDNSKFRSRMAKEAGDTPRNIVIRSSIGTQ